MTPDPEKALMMKEPSGTEEPANMRFIKHGTLAATLFQGVAFFLVVYNVPPMSLRFVVWLFAVLFSFAGLIASCMVGDSLDPLKDKPPVTGKRNPWRDVDFLRGGVLILGMTQTLSFIFIALSFAAWMDPWTFGSKDTGDGFIFHLLATTYAAIGVLVIIVCSIFWFVDEWIFRKPLERVEAADYEMTTALAKTFQRVGEERIKIEFEPGAPFALFWHLGKEVGGSRYERLESAFSIEDGTCPVVMVRHLKDELAHGRAHEPRNQGSPRDGGGCLRPRPELRRRPPQRLGRGACAWNVECVARVSEEYPRCHTLRYQHHMSLTPRDAFLEEAALWESVTRALALKRASIVVPDAVVRLQPREVE